MTRNLTIRAFGKACVNYGDEVGDATLENNFYQKTSYELLQ